MTHQPPVATGRPDGRDDAHPVERLFAALPVVEPYPPGVVCVPNRLPGLAFFPGGAGLWGAAPGRALPPMPVGGVLILGHNFHCEAGFAQFLARGYESERGPTWRPLLDLLARVGIPKESCFFSNVYMGLKAGDKPTGVFPGSRDSAFVARCRAFLACQLAMMQPRLILTLGKYAPPVLTPLAPALDAAWSGALTLGEIDTRKAAVVRDVSFPEVTHRVSVVALCHPAQRPPNVARRRYRGYIGDAAEVAMLRDVYRGRECR